MDGVIHATVGLSRVKISIERLKPFVNYMINSGIIVAS